jgi:hypothetical protein
MTGIPLREAVIRFGDLARPRWYQAFGETLRLRATMAPAGVEVPIDDAQLTRYVDAQFDGQRAVVEKLRDGKLIACGFTPGAVGAAGKPFTIPTERWSAGLEPDFEGCCAIDGRGEVIATDITVSAASEPGRRGPKPVKFAQAKNAVLAKYPKPAALRRAWERGQEALAKEFGVSVKLMRKVVDSILLPPTTALTRRPNCSLLIRKK